MMSSSILVNKQENLDRVTYKEQKCLAYKCTAVIQIRVPGWLASEESRLSGGTLLTSPVHSHDRREKDTCQDSCVRERIPFMWLLPHALSISKITHRIIT